MYKITYLNKRGERGFVGQPFSLKRAAEIWLQGLLETNTQKDLAKYYGLQAVGSFKVQEYRTPEWSLDYNSEQDIYLNTLERLTQEYFGSFNPNGYIRAENDSLRAAMNTNRYWIDSERTVQYELPDLSHISSCSFD